MLSADCHDTPIKGCCGGNDGRELYWCGTWLDCPGIYDSCLCFRQCPSYKVCGYDSWYSEFHCEYPPPKTDPQGERFCNWWECIPDCDGKDCGDDGCGGTCGTCDDNLQCVDGVCTWEGIKDCKGYDTHSWVGCNGLDLAGCCDSQGRTLYCSSGKVYCVDCEAVDPQCGWVWENAWYDCGTAGGEDPSGNNPKLCNICIPSCPAGWACVGGECIK